jgi:phospho-N-acetylmuramoyl-pentapeptide-transferase
MSEILKDSLEKLFLSTIVSAIFAPLMISILYKFNQVSGIRRSKIGAGDGDNTLFMKIMNSATTNGTPNMGGILIWIVVPLMVFLLVPMTPIIKVFLFGFLLFGFWGFIDVVVFTNGFRHSEKIKAFQETFEWRMGKLSFSIMLNLLVMYLLYRTGLFTSLSILDLFVINITPIILVIIATVGQFAIYAAELTDGADGLMMGIFTIINFAMMLLLIVQQRYEFLPILCIILGVQIIDLYFNIPPARFWNGGPGAMPLGYTMFFVALLTNNIPAYFLMSSITWLIMASSAIQMFSMKFFKKRVFKIAPIHHHFQANGWPQYKVTMRFWLFTIITCVIGVYVGLL